MRYLLLIFSITLLFFSALAQNRTEYNNLQELLNIYIGNEEYESAVPVAEKVILAAKNVFSENSLEYAISLGTLANLYQKISQLDKAELLYIQVNTILKIIVGENDKNYASGLNNLALIYVEMYKYDKAETLYIQSNIILQKTVGEKDIEYGRNLKNMAELYFTQGKYNKAEPIYVQSNLILKEKLGDDHPDYALGLNNLGLLYIKKEEYSKSEPLLLQAGNIIKRKFGENHIQYADNLANFALLYFNLGYYAKAESAFLRSNDIKKTVLGENNSAYAYSLKNMGGFYIQIGQYEKGELMLNQAINIQKKTIGETRPEYAESLTVLATLYRVTDKFEKAEKLYTEAIEIINKTLDENHPDYIYNIRGLAEVYLVTKKYEDAENLYKQVIEIYNKSKKKDGIDYIFGLTGLGYLYESKGEYEKAKQFYIKAKDIFKKKLGETHHYYSFFLNYLEKIYETLGEYSTAEILLTQIKSIEIKNLLNIFSVLSEKEKGNFLENNVELIDNNNGFLYKNPHASLSFYRDNFNLQLLFKSFSLADTKNSIDAIRKSKDAAVQTLYNKWHSLKLLLTKQYSLPLTDRRADLSTTETQTENIEKQLNRISVSFRNLQQTMQIKIGEVQKSLKQNEAAIEFVRFNFYNKKWTDSTMYAAYILRKNDSIPVFIPLFEEKQLQQLFDSVGTTATTMVSKFYRGLEVKNKNAAGALGTELYKLIWQPLEPFLQGVKKISYSPAGKLYSIAFHALPVDSATVLMDKYQLQQYTSTRQVALRNEDNQTTKPASITLFGNASFTMDSMQLAKQKTNRENISTTIYTPKKRSDDNGTWNDLPGTAEEVKKIKVLFDQNKISTQSFVQAKATEENLKALSGNSPQILHIATHGFFLPEPDKKRKENNFNNENTYTLADDPLLRSGLILSGGNYAWSGKTPIEGVEDGIATAYEISQLNLSNTELVVLSACETALGDVKGSEGVFGLQRAFKMAGVKKMIVSLWQVPDKETAELMISFYGYWMKGKTINDAFAQAQADMRKKYSPFYWAAFVLVE